MTCVPRGWTAWMNPVIRAGSQRCSTMSESPNPTWNCSGRPRSTPAHRTCRSRTGSSRRACPSFLHRRGHAPRRPGAPPGGGRFWMEMEAKAVSHDRLEPGCPVGGLRERAGVGKSEAIGADVTVGEFLGHRLQPDNLPGRLAGDLCHLVRGQQLTAAVAGVDEIAADAGCG